MGELLLNLMCYKLKLWTEIPKEEYRLKDLRQLGEDPAKEDSTEHTTKHGRKEWTSKNYKWMKYAFIIYYIYY